MSKKTMTKEEMKKNAVDAEFEDQIDEEVDDVENEEEELNAEELYSFKSLDDILAAADEIKAAKKAEAKQKRKGRLKKLAIPVLGGAAIVGTAVGYFIGRKANDGDDEEDGFGNDILDDDCPTIEPTTVSVDSSDGINVEEF